MGRRNGVAGDAARRESALLEKGSPIWSAKQCPAVKALLLAKRIYRWAGFHGSTKLSAEFKSRF